jgi:SOS-response transcriptional repressor LexA
MQVHSPELNSNCYSLSSSDCFYSWCYVRPVDLEALFDYRRVRLQDLVDQKFNGTKAALGRALGHQDGAFVGQMIRGERPITEKTVEQVHELPGAAGWFQAPDATNIAPGPSIKGRLPLISWIQAGNWNGSNLLTLRADEVERWLDCPATHSENSYALRVRGDSMTAPHGNVRTYPAGCVIFVDPARRSPVNGERIIAKLDGSDEVTFKIFKQEDGRIWLQPINPTHDKLTQPFKVLGTVIGKWEDE